MFDECNPYSDLPFDFLRAVHYWEVPFGAVFAVSWLLEVDF